MLDEAIEYLKQLQLQVQVSILFQWLGEYLSKEFITSCTNLFCPILQESNISKARSIVNQRMYNRCTKLKKIK